MRKITIALCLVLMAGFAVGQDDVYYQPEKKVKSTVPVNLDYPEDKLQYQFDFVRHCLKRNYDQRKLAYGIQAGGFLMLAASMKINDDEKALKDGLNIVGGAAVLTGFAMILDSDKWLKRAYIGPDGVGVVYKF